MRGSWRPNRTATYWPLLLWPSAFLSRSPALLNRRPGGQPLWVLVFSTASYLQLVWSPNSIGGPEGPFCQCCFLYSIIFQLSDLQTHSGVLRAPSARCCFPYSIIFQLSDLQNSLNFLCTELYNSSMPTQYLPITGYRNVHFRCL